MNLDLTGKTALVCGSSQGLGLASAIEISKLGARVILFSRNEQRLQKALAALDTTHGQQHAYLLADFNFPEQVKTAVHGFLQKEDTVHILVNNTGGPPAGPILTAGTDEFLAGFKSHLICNQILVQAVVPGMKKAQFGRIINIISTSVKRPLPGLGVSNTTRGAVANWAKTLSLEVGPYGITVNNVLPGYTRTARYDALMKSKSESTGKSAAEVEKDNTDSIPMRRIGDPEDFGAAVAFLSSPAASYITGINLPVDGGRLGCL